MLAVKIDNPDMENKFKCYALEHKKTVDKYVLSHNMGIYDLPLWTYNKKDFKFIDGVNLI